MLLMLCSLLIGCSDEDDKIAALEFPVWPEWDGRIGEEKALVFDAPADWTLTSSALWCCFVVAGEDVHACSGTAGRQTVTLRINDGASELMKTYEAELTLRMGGERKVIGKVTRPVTGYEVSACNEDGTVAFTAENPFVEDYDGTNRLVVTANFDWVVEASGGLEVGSVASGLAGEKVLLRPSPVKGYAKEAWQTALDFKNKAGEIVARVPVKYEGIPADRIEFSHENPIGMPVTFDENGAAYTIGEKTYEGAMPIQVTAKENQYRVVYVGYEKVIHDWTYEYEYTFTQLAEEDAWFWVEDDAAGNLRLAAAYNNGQARSGYLMVFPVAVYDKIRADFETEVFRVEGINELYLDYIAASVEQVANSCLLRGFALTDGEGNPLSDGEGGIVEAYAYQEQGGELTDEELLAKYGTTNVYMLSLPLNVGYDMILAKPNGFSGMYLQPDAYVGGKNTLWEGVELEMSYPDGMYIYGLDSGINGSEQMTITCWDQENVYAVLLVLPRYGDC